MIKKLINRINIFLNKIEKHLIYLSQDFLKYFYASFITFVIMSVMALISMALPENYGNILFSESGFIEGITVILYALCFLLFVQTHKITVFKRNISAAALIIFFALRELDYHTEFTTVSILKIEFLFSPNVPINEKFVGGIMLLLLLCSIIHFVIVHAKKYYKDIIELKSYAWVFGFGFGLTVTAKSIDGIRRKLSSFNLNITDYSNELFRRCEEIYELGIPMAFILSILLFKMNGMRQPPRPIARPT